MCRSGNRKEHYTAPHHDMTLVSFIKGQPPADALHTTAPCTIASHTSALPTVALHDTCAAAEEENADVLECVARLCEEVQRALPNRYHFMSADSLHVTIRTLQLQG